MESIAVVIVSYNSAPFLSKCLSALEGQTRRPDLVIIVDSGSSDTAYLATAHNSSLCCKVVLESNVGFCVGNNIGWALSKHCDFVLFVNPDAFLAPDFLERAVAYLDDQANSKIGILTGTLLRYDIEADRPTGFVDSTGVIQRWYGRIIDRDQSKPESVLRKYDSPNLIPAICAAVALCRAQALMDVADGGDVFDPSFFMYKDDIDLSWRVRKAGWLLVHHPRLLAYHCRGFKNRSSVPGKLRLLSARNEIKLHLKHRSAYVLCSLAKYFLVRTLGV
jgi:N-acetylglucosaminyl-diphospho-decaprenol L-rhamnosyltransferase